MKQIEVKLSALKEGKPHEYAMRFVFGGLTTVLAGLIAMHFGPGVGGLFLAFPAIFPASVSLVESHEKARKARIGADGTNRGRLSASLDAEGASLGCIGLLAFALVLWKGLKNHNAYLVIATAVVFWLLVSYSLWAVRADRLLRRKRVTVEE
jgi:hypothetical protein